MVLGLQGCCCDVFFQVMAGDGCKTVVICLLGRFVSCLAGVGSMWGILKLACRQFLGGAVSNVFMIGVVGISGSAGGASERKTGSCLGLSKECIQHGEICCCI